MGNEFNLAVWIAAALMLCYYSGIYKENPFYRMVEHLFVGVSAANGVVSTYENYIRPTLTIDIARDGKFHFIIPIIIGLLIYTRFLPNKDVNWLARIPLAFWVGIGSAVVIVRNFKANFLGQITATFVPLVHSDPMTMFNNIVLVVGVFTVITYFFFTIEQKGALAISARIGRYVMMIAFGAAYGNTIMARSAVLLGRIQYLLGNWLGLISTRV